MAAYTKDSEGNLQIIDDPYIAPATDEYSNEMNDILPSSLPLASSYSKNGNFRPSQNQIKLINIPKGSFYAGQKVYVYTGVRQSLESYLKASALKASKIDAKWFVKSVRVCKAD